MPGDDIEDFEGSFSIQDERAEGEHKSVLKGTWDRRSAEKLWLVSYSDFMTIMMIFFLAMFGYSHMVEVRREKARTPLPYPEFSKIVEELKEKLGDQVRVIDEMSKVTVELGDDVLFPSGSSVLNDRARTTLSDLASSIGRVDGDIIVEGHTDNIPVFSARYRSNWELSAARAFSVVDALSKAGIAPARLAAWGFGENRPVANNDDEENRLKNRRIDIVVLKKVPGAK